MDKTIEKVKFRLYHMPCCGHLLCWVNPRHPSYCPCCGKLVYPDVKQAVMQSDEDAELHLELK